MLVRTRRFVGGLTLLAVTLLLAAACVARADLFTYVNKPDAAYKWELRGVTDVPNGKIYDLHLVSQVWQGITWEHQLQVYEPTTVEFPDVMPLYITGGGAGDDDKALGLTIANGVGSRVAILYHIPNQPLFNGLTEDALISYTWVKYMETGDEDWICNFAMVKATLRAMDCLQEFAQQQWQTKLRGFVPLGASKRGWTTYLTGIADRERVIAMAPMVFDILNMPVNVQHQRDFWGAYSPEIADYTEKGLEQMFETGRGFQLFWMVDPYTYRDHLQMPKLVILGSNDPYWPTDAVNFYWAGLPSPKLLLIAPNSGHGLNDAARVLGSIGAYIRLIAQHKPLPVLQGKWDEAPEGLTLTVKTDTTPIETRVWVARSPIRDFRPAKWGEAPLPAAGEAFVTTVARAEGQYTAAYGEVVFDVDGRRLTCSTQPRVMAPLAK